MSNPTADPNLLVSEIAKELREAANIMDHPETQHAMRIIGRDYRRLRWLMGHAADTIDRFNAIPAGEPNDPCDRPGWDRSL